VLVGTLVLLNVYIQLVRYFFDLDCSLLGACLSVQGLFDELLELLKKISAFFREFFKILSRFYFNFICFQLYNL
jgi:hypothetical protein